MEFDQNKFLWVMYSVPTAPHENPGTQGHKRDLCEQCVWTYLYKNLFELALNHFKQNEVALRTKF